MEFDDNQQPWRFSPLRVVAAGAGFVLRNLRQVAGWSVAPLLLGLVSNVLLPGMPEQEGGGQHGMGPLLLLALLLFWVRMPLELRLYRKGVLREEPGLYYGQQLFTLPTLRYMGCYLKVAGVMLLAMVVPSMVLALGLSAAFGGGGKEAGAPWAVVAACLGFAASYIWIAPRCVMVFADTALGGEMLLFDRTRGMLLALKARWRIAGAMALIWAPEYLTLMLSQLGPAFGWWGDGVAAFVLLCLQYLFSFVGMVLSCAVGALIYARLRNAPEPAETP